MQNQYRSEDRNSPGHARQAQRKKFQRNQGLGLLLIAFAILLYRLVHTPHGWIFPPGWWHFW